MTLLKSPIKTSLLFTQICVNSTIDAARNHAFIALSLGAIAVAGYFDVWSVGGVVSASEQSERTEGIQTVVVQVYCRLSGSFHIQFHRTGVAPTLRFGHRQIDVAASIGAVPSLHLCHAKRHTLSRSDACCDITTSRERHSARAGFMGCYFRSDDRCIGP
jgi:hypothetical protein